MRKIFNWINKNRKFIFSFVVIIMLIGIFIQINNSIYAATNPEYYEPADDQVNNIKLLFSSLTSVGIGVLGKPIAAIVNLVNVLLLILMYSIFVGTGVTSGFKFPFPDQIVFNGIPMLDPNFINPVNDDFAIVNIMSSIVQKMYYSFFTLAGTVFVLAAVIIGIKLAFSSLASQKAQYKEAIKHWVSGIAVLFLMHIVLAGMFAINEQICVSASKLCNNIPITINVLEVIPAGGSTIKGILNTISSMFGTENIADELNITVQGYWGVIIKFAVNGILNSDIIYSIGLSIMLGQTFSLIIMYLKRVFYCIILGMIAPLVVAMDTIQKVVTGRDTGILKTWFQNMVAIIFTQSFQAIFMCVTIIIIGKVTEFESTGANMDMIIAIIAVVGLNAIMKFDKLFKEILGIKDSKIMGGFNENAMKSFAAIKSGMDLARRSVEPFKKRGEARARLNDATKKRDKLLADMKGANANGAAAGSTTLASNNTTIQNNGANTNQGSHANAASQGAASNDQVVTALTNLTNALNKNTSVKEDEKRQKLTDDLANAEAEVRKARADQRAESIRAFTRFGTTLGAVGFGAGATDNFGDAVTVGNLVDMPMDAITDRSINRGVYGNTSRKYSTDKSKSAFVDKYMNDGGLSREAAEKAAEKSMANIQAQLNKQIPETVSHMITDVTKEAAAGAADILSRNGKKYSKKVRKDLYSSTKIDDI